MGSTLKNVIAFTGLEVGVPASLPHGINLEGRSVAPDLVLPASTGYTVTADETDITVTRLADSAAAINVYCERWHSYERALPLPGQLAGLIPFVAGGGSGGGGGSTPFLTVDPTVQTETFDLAPNVLSIGGAHDPEQVAQLPAANSVPNGTIIGLLVVEGGGEWGVLTAGADTINPGGGSLWDVDASNGFVFLITDGVSVWYTLSFYRPE